VFAAADGVVTDSDNGPGGSGGRVMHIDHDNGWGTDYLHMASCDVPAGTRVSQGQRIGASGASGYGQNYYYGPHLHISLRPNHDHGYGGRGNVDFALHVGAGGGSGGVDAEVKEAQQLLVNLGYDTGGVDGISGPKTKAALHDFQSKNGLTVDELVGPQTIGALRAAVAAPKVDAEVKEAQQLLVNLGYDTGGIDGISGPKTKAALKDFQAKNGLTVDELVGPQTLGALRAKQPAPVPVTPPTTPAPPTATGSLDGIDISAWQNGIDLSKVPAAFVIVKATQGTDYVSGDFDRQINQTLDLGKLAGIYHFADGDDVTAEAKHFLAIAKKYAGKAVPFLDYEGAVLVKGGTWARKWLDIILSEWGTHAPIYLQYTAAIDEDYDTVVQGGYALWRAGNDGIGGGYHVAEALDKGRWPSVMMDQYTSQGELPGWSGRLDLDRFYGDAALWQQFAAVGDSIPAPVPVPVNPTPTPPPAPAGMGPISVDGILGSQTIKKLQTRLQEKGFYSGNIDGELSKPTSLTISGLESYLNEVGGYGLAVDGDPFSLNQTGPSGKTHTNEAIQRRVGAPSADGYFDVPESNGIRAFQTALNNNTF
jgi:peptidoglycan hydrolase-like protein with peptidoglycan-binding domain